MSDYQPTTWIDEVEGVQEGTPVDAEKLNNMEQGIVDAHKKADAAAASAASAEASAESAGKEAESAANTIKKWSDKSGDIDGSNLADGSVTGDALADKTVTADKIDTDDLFAQTIIAKSGLSIPGSNVLLFSDHGGGWYMVDDTWLRVYGSKNVYADQQLKVGKRLDVGDSVAIVGDSGYMTLNTLNVVGDVTANAVIANSGVNVKGTSKLQFSDYGGGWYMEDTEWLRSYGSKRVYLDSDLRVDGRILLGPTGTYYVDSDGSVNLGSATVTGQLSLGGKSFIYGDTGLAQLSSLLVNGNTQLAVGNVTGSWNVGADLEVGGLAYFKNTMSVTGEATFGGGMNASGLNSFTGKAVFSGGVEMTSDLTCNNPVYDMYGYSYPTSNNNPVTYVSSSGRLALYASSSKRYKHDIADASENIYKALLELPVVTYHYNSGYDEADPEGEKEHIGFIAEDVAEIYPKACGYRDGKPENWNVMEVVPGLLALLQNAYKRIDDLEERVKALEGVKA